MVIRQLSTHTDICECLYTHIYTHSNKSIEGIKKFASKQFPHQKALEEASVLLHEIKDNYVTDLDQ